jgi:hypothetical protein
MPGDFSPFLWMLARQPQGNGNAEEREQNKPDNKTPLRRIVGRLWRIPDGGAAERTVGATTRYRHTAAGADDIFHGEAKTSFG